MKKKDLSRVTAIVIGKDAEPWQGGTLQKRQ